MNLVCPSVVRRLRIRSLVCCWLLSSTMISFAHAAEAPFSFDNAPGRLPKDVVPTEYQIDIVPDAGSRTFRGRETVTLQVRTATARVVFNTLDIGLNDVKFDGVAVQATATDNDAQLTTVTLASPAAVGVHKLTFSYHGLIQTQPQGLFVQPYTNADGSHGLMLTTEMEATDARRMFPCWDEPAFRATFQLTAEIPAGWSAVSNMPIAKRVVKGKLATVTFDRTPSMPTYLVDFNAGDLREITAKSDGMTFGVWAIRGREQDGRTALADTQQILADYNDYFGYRFPLPKLDSIAIPGGFSGAMENWGAITYTSRALLVSPDSSLSDRQEVYSTQAHEIAHQWNGDLVTMGWWDDLWLNESFASWRAAKETDLRNPSWKWWEGQDADKEAAMRADAQTSSHAIQVHVTDELEASNAFDPVITYSKGQAVLRMFENYLGADTFRDGVRRYIKQRAFSNATSADLWQALSAAGNQDVAAIAAGWTEQPGFPVVAVTSHCAADGARTVTLSQRRFLLQSDDDTASPHWSVPLLVRSGSEATPKSVLLTRDGQQEKAGSCGEPLSINANAIGYFRSEYDAATLSANTRNFTSLPDGDRIALLDDQWALVDAGAARLPTYLALASSMGDDLDARAWYQIAGALGTIEFDERGTPGYEAYAAYARGLLKPAADRLGWDSRPDETPAVQQLRRTVLRDLGIWGDPQVIDEARKRFSAFIKDHRAVVPDDQATVFSIVGLYADADTFSQLHELARGSKDDAQRARLYTAMAQVRDPQLAAQVVQIVSSTELPPQDATLPLQMVGTLSREQPKLAWDLLTGNYQRMLAPFGGMAPMFLTQEMPQLFWNSVPMEQLEGWMKAHVPAGMDADVAKGVQAGRLKLTEKNAFVSAVDGYLSTRAHAA